MQRCCQQTNEVLMREKFLFQCFWIVACQHSFGNSYFLDTCHFQFFRENLAFDVKRSFPYGFLVKPSLLTSWSLVFSKLQSSIGMLCRCSVHKHVLKLTHWMSSCLMVDWYQSDCGLNSSPSIDNLAPQNVALTLLRLFSVQSERTTYMDCRIFYLHMSIAGKGYSTERSAVLTPASERKQAYWCFGEQMIWTDKVEM